MAQTDLNLQPEQKARVLIDEMLRAADWLPYWRVPLPFRGGQNAVRA